MLLAGIAVLTGPLFLRTSALFQPVVFDQLAWGAALYALLRLEQTDDPRWWWWLGLAGGLGLLTKFSIAFIGAGVLAALLLTPRRRALLTAGPWIALGIALVVGSPSIVGQIALGFPVTEQLEGLRGSQLARITWGEFLATQPLMMGPAILLALAGAVAPFADQRLRPFRSVAIACLATFVLLGVLQGKPYYAGTIFPALREAEDHFDIDDVTSAITDKLIRRHPHVFADASAATSSEVLAQWEAIKAEEKRARGSEEGRTRVLEGVPGALPALPQAQKISARVAKVGFDWEDAAGCSRKVREELDEVERAAASGDPAAVEAEIGDLLFAVVSLARMHDCDAETALRRASRRFTRRFTYVEDRLHAEGRSPREATLAEMDALWDEDKAKLEE